MSHQFNAQSVLDGVVSSDPRVPGVVAMVTDRERNIFEGAAEIQAQVIARRLLDGTN